MTLSQTQPDGARLTPVARHQAAFAYVASRLLNRPHAVAVHFEVPAPSVEGVLVAHGSKAGGYSLFVQDERVHYVHNYLGVLELHLASDEVVPVGPLSVRFEFEPNGTSPVGISRGTPGWARLFFNDRLVGEKHLPVTLPFALAIGGGVCVGHDGGRGISQMYDPPFEFNGQLDSVAYRFEDESIYVYQATPHASSLDPM